MSVFFLSCNQGTSSEQLSPVEADAKKAAGILCKTRELMSKIGQEEEGAMKDMETFENDNGDLLRSFSEKYPIHTEEGQEFVKLINDYLKECEE